MTDEEIEKAVECCNNPNGCTENCPFHKYMKQGKDCNRLFGKYLEQYVKYKMEQVSRDTAKEILDDLKEACPQGYLGIVLWIRKEYIKYGVEVVDE